mmetsp:Transcript_68224/g.99817  ORF Transcript_68224/g.99817 Transcript_68224/m.99817 type:complete len:115 (+) Transcript_68224:313-657(+)
MMATTARASSAWATGDNISHLCLEQRRSLRLHKDWNWRGGSGTGPSNLTLDGCLNLQIRDSHADGYQIMSCITDRTTTSRLTRGGQVSGDGAHLPFQMEPVGKTMPWSHALSGV